MTKTGIEWCDVVWNPVTGCTKVSAGCQHCYAESVAERFWATQYPEVPSAELQAEGDSLTMTRPRRFTDVQTHPDRLDAPLRWRKPRRVFVNSMSDLFHEDVPDGFLLRTFDVMRLGGRSSGQGRDHTFLVLTKRPERARRFMKALRWDPGPLGLHLERGPGVSAAPLLRNVHLGVSIEDQATADERIPILLDTPAAVRWVSAEPLLEPVALRGMQCGGCGYTARDKREQLDHRLCKQATPILDWIVTGGESGPQARPCEVSWIRSIVKQCKAAAVPAFVKQLGACSIVFPDHLNRTFPPGTPTEVMAEALGDFLDGTVRLPLIHPKGADPTEWPADLRVQELPS